MMTREEDTPQIVKSGLNYQLKLRLHDYSDAYMPVKWIITITKAGADKDAKNVDEWSIAQMILIDHVKF